MRLSLVFGLAVAALLLVSPSSADSNRTHTGRYDRLLHKLRLRHTYYDFKDGFLVKEMMSAWPTVATFYNGPYPTREEMQREWLKAAHFNAQGFMLHIGADNEEHAVLVVEAVHHILKHFSLLANWKFVCAKDLSRVWTPKDALVGKLVTIYPRNDAVLTAIVEKLLKLFIKVKAKGLAPPSIQRSCVDPVLGDIESPLSIRYGVFKQFAPTACLVKVNQQGQCLDKWGQRIPDCENSGAVVMEVLDPFSVFWKPKWVTWDPFGDLEVPVFLPKHLPECQCHNCDRKDDEDVYTTYSPIMPK